MIDSLLELIQQNYFWALSIVFLIAFAESMAIIGLLVPGWALLVGVGGLIGADLLDFYPVVLSAYLGAVLGESLSFYLGIRFKHQILSWQYFQKHQALVTKSETFFAKHGAIGVFVGCFIGPVRAFLPLVAGLSGMNSRTFLWVNLSSALLWAPFYLIPGILVGAAVTIDQEIAASLLLILFLLGLVVSFAVSKTKALKQSRQQQASLILPLMNCLLAWSILIVSLGYLYQSSYRFFIQDLFALVADKI